jgi:hypothetical protein
MCQRRLTFGPTKLLVAAQLGIAALVIVSVRGNVAAEETAPRQVVGSVVDEQGKPAAAARLWWRVRHTPDERDSTVEGASDEEGKFRLQAPPAWKPERPSAASNMLWVLAKGKSLTVVRAIQESDSNGKETGLVIRLSPAGDTSFRVFDSRGAPLAGVTVEPWHFLGPHNGYDIIPEPIRNRLRATTDGSGTVEMPAMPRKGFLTAQLAEESFGIQQVRLDDLESAPAERLITLRETGRIEGRLIADKPEWTRGVKLFFTTSLDSRYLGENFAADAEGTAGTVTDDAGRFVVPAIASGKLRIESRAVKNSPFLPNLPENVEVRRGATSEVEIPMIEGLVVRGRIRTEDTQEPVPGAEIHIYYGVQRQGENVVSDAAGRFEALALPGKVAAQVIVLPKEFGERYEQTGAPWSERQETGANAREFELRPIVLSRVAAIEGKLLDHRGRPMAKTRLNGVVKFRRYGFGQTDDEGRFSINVPRQIALESYEVWPDPQTRRVPLVEQREPLILRLEAPPDAEP